MNFLLDLTFAALGMTLGAVVGFLGFMQLFLSSAMHPAVALGLAVLAALVSAGALGIVGANVRTWLRRGRRA